MYKWDSDALLKYSKNYIVENIKRAFRFDKYSESYYNTYDKNIYDKPTILEAKYDMYKPKIKLYCRKLKSAGFGENYFDSFWYISLFIAVLNKRPVLSTLKI